MKITKYIPSPFSIALLLTLLTFCIALFNKPNHASFADYTVQLAMHWQNGLWDNSSGGLYFAFQMMFILILGHCLALTPAVEKFLTRITRYCKTTASSALTVALVTLLFTFINWGLGLIVGALLARKIGEKFMNAQQQLNYGLIGAAAYSGMLVWHGGLSGSAPTKAMEKNAIRSMMENVGFEWSATYPSELEINATLFSHMNIFVSLSMLLVVPLSLYWIGKRTKNREIPTLPQHQQDKTLVSNVKHRSIDTFSFFGKISGLLILSVALLIALTYSGNTAGFFTINYINLILLGLALTLHQSISAFLKGIEEAIGDASGILIQFPLYFGIMGIISGSGLITEISTYLTSISNSFSFPFYSFLSAGIVNFFIPSGGGQWYIQGPLLLKSASELGVSIPKTIMALAYGDQWTNMLQPFWALPLMGITKIKVHQLLPYTFILFLIGGVIFTLALLLT
jgi:short-chain fatty acids transporter